MQSAGGGRLAENVLLFCRTLRGAGVPLGPGQVVDALRAAHLTGLAHRDDFYHAMRATLVKDVAHFTIFHQAFHVYFRDPQILERAMSLLLPALASDRSEAPSGAMLRRLLEALRGTDDSPADASLREIDRAESWSYAEVLREKDFEQMSLAELAEAKAVLRRNVAPAWQVPTRRYRADTVGHRYDLRRSMQLLARNNGQLLALARKRRRKRRLPIVLICDISGSMAAYSRMFLHFSHILATVNVTHSFVFGTQLTNVTRQLSCRDADQALARVAQAVSDWDGGTRIAACLERFNLDWNRRVLGRSAMVILLTDGLERDSASNLALQMQRLRHSCRQLIWLNPVLRYRDFQPLAQGIRAMLPHVDRFLPAHNLRSLVELCAVLQASDPERRQHRPAVVRERSEAT